MKKLGIYLIFLLLATSVFSKELTSEDVKNLLSDGSTVVVDTRLTDAFNGWKVDNIKKGGHIEGSTDFSYTFVEGEEYRIAANLKDRGITPEKNIVLYDTNGKDHKIVEEFLRGRGFENISYFNLTNDNVDTFNMRSYPNYELLVPAWWVKDALDGKGDYHGSEVKVFEVAWGPLVKDISYLKGHIKGAVHINTDEVEPAPTWMLAPDEDLLEVARKNGIKKDMTVVLYGKDVMASYRVASILMYIGVKDVRVLNGGINAWKREKYPLELKINTKKPLPKKDIVAIENKDFIVTTKEVREKLGVDDNFQLVDIRSLDEHEGKTSGYSYFHKKGRPKGAVWGKAGTTSVKLEDYRNPDDTFKNGYLMKEMWKDLGVDENKDLAFFCGSGWRAGEVFFYSKVMDIKSTHVYSDGWMGWSSSKENPVEVYSEGK